MILSGKVRKTQKPLSPIAPRDQLTFSINIQLIQLNVKFGCHKKIPQRLCLKFTINSVWDSHD